MVPLQAALDISLGLREAGVDGPGINIPNFFLMTLRIFFWSNFLGRPWTVVRVLRPLRSVGEDKSARLSRIRGVRRGVVCAAQRPSGQGIRENKRTLNTNVYVILRLLGLSCVFVGFGEGVYRTRNVSCATRAGSAIRFELGTQKDSAEPLRYCQTRDGVCIVLSS
jgi:hypothetical protein